MVTKQTSCQQPQSQEVPLVTKMIRKEEKCCRETISFLYIEKNETKKEPEAFHDRKQSEWKKVFANKECMQKPVTGPFKKD